MVTTLKNKIRESFDQIHATGQMKASTYSFLLQKIENGTSKKPHIARILVAACAFLFLCTSFGWRFWNTPISYLSVDINPSIEFTLNRFNYVIDAKEQNPDGEHIVKQLHLTGKKYLKAVELLVESDAMQKYLNNDATLTFTVASPEAEKLLKDLENSPVSNQYHGTCHSADMASAHAAHQCGMSIGKYQIYLYLSAYDPSITLEDCQSMTMHQLRSLLSRYESPNTNDYYSQPHHGGHHH